MLKSGLSQMKTAIDRGIQDGVDDGEAAASLARARAGLRAMTQAVNNKDRSILTTIDVGLMKQWAYRGLQDRIDDKEISEGVAKSLRMEVDKFFEFMKAVR
jgi:hypothetical protein